MSIIMVMDDIRREAILTCGDVNLGDIHSVIQGHGKTAITQDGP